jgi:hypothetical protein
MLHLLIQRGMRSRTEGLLPSCHELVYMILRPIVPILPSDRCQPRIPTHTILPIISFTSGYSSDIIQSPRKKDLRFAPSFPGPRTR